MTTVSELVRDVLGSVATDAGGPACAKWIDNRYKEMLSKVKYRSLRTVGELAVPAIVNTGTAEVTTATTAVTGTSTTWTTSPGSGDHDDWYIRLASAWYRVASVTDDTNLVLDTAFAEDTISTATSYSLVKRNHSLSSDARRLGSFVFTRLRQDLELISSDELNIIAPGRILAGSIPQYVAEIGIDSSGYKQVEIYPPPTDTEIIHYIYWKIPTALAIGTTIPQYIDAYVLKEGALIDLMRYEMARALRAGNVDAAATWRNEYRTQETKWKNIMKHAARQDRGVDDTTLILSMISDVNRSRFADIATARDHVISNWNYPG